MAWRRRNGVRIRETIGLVFLIAVAGVPWSARAQIQHGTVYGTVVDPSGTPIPGAAVTLLDGLGARVQSVTADGGDFRFTNVAPGTYSLRADRAPFHGLVQAVTVGGALPLRVDLRLSASVAEQVVVRAEPLDPGPTTTRITLAGEAVRRAPARIRSRGLLDAVATAPGWATEDNGLLHVRGVDDGFLYVVDGVPVYERLDGLFGVAPDPSMIESVNVLTGYVPPEYGFKSGGVIEVRSVGRAADNWLASADVGIGTERARDFSSLAGGPLGDDTALTLGIAGLRSSRFLDPVHPDNLHNDGGSLSGGGQFGWNLSPASQLSAVAGFGRSTFDVPHGEIQDAAGQHQRQRLRTQWQTVSWQRTWSANTVSQIAGYHRFGRSSLAGSAGDVPLFTSADRTLRRFGGLASFTHHRGRHLLKVGAEASRLHLREDFGFFVTDADVAHDLDLSADAIGHTRERPFAFHDRATPTLLSVYAQDSIHMSDGFTLDLGVRGDRSRMLTPASRWSPRLGAAYRRPATQTTVRGSFSGFFQPPQPEHLLLASSEQARALSPFVDERGGGGAAIEPERQTALETGLNQFVGRHLRLDLSFWWRRVEPFNSASGWRCGSGLRADQSSRGLDQALHRPGAEAGRRFRPSGDADHPQRCR